MQRFSRGIGSLALLSLFTLQSACRGTTGDAELKGSVVTPTAPTVQLPPLPCTGDAFVFGLTALPDISGINLTPQGSDFDVALLSPQPGTNIRLDVCEIDDKPVLQRITTLTKNFGSLQVAVYVLDPHATAVSKVSAFGMKTYTAPPASAQTPGYQIIGDLSAALGGTYQGFQVLFDMPDEGTGPLATKQHFALEGKSMAGKDFLAGAQYFKNLNTAGQFKTFATIIGTIDAFDPLQTPDQCGDSAVFKTSEIILDGATIKTEQCVSLEFGGGTFNPNYRKVSVTDSSPNLPEAVRGKEFKVEGDAVQNIGEGIATVGSVLTNVPASIDVNHFYFHHMHHNGCDAFVLRLPHATYAATGSAQAGNCRIMRGAPIRTDLTGGGGTLADAGTLVRIDRGSNIVCLLSKSCSAFWDCKGQNEQPQSDCKVNQ